MKKEGVGNTASKLPILLAIPGVAFWVVLVLWWNDHRSGEHYEYLASEWLLFFVDAACFLAACIGGTICWWFDKRSTFWWIAAAAALTPLGFVGWMLL
ncbi:MAG: hypothetical protein ACJ73D_09460 [Pyrinomonadaceae bacterium]